MIWYVTTFRLFNRPFSPLFTSSTTDQTRVPRQARRRWSGIVTGFQMSLGLSLIQLTLSPLWTRSFLKMCEIFHFIDVFHMSKVELSLAYGCSDSVDHETMLQYIHYNRHHNSLKINATGESFRKVKIIWLLIYTCRKSYWGAQDRNPRGCGEKDHRTGEEDHQQHRTEQEQWDPFSQH